MTYNFKHKLNFLDLPSVGTIIISEPDGFDGSSFKVEQDSKRYGRDVYIANEEIELEFSRDLFERLQTAQQLIDGTVINYASKGYDFILDVYKNEGWEGRIEYIIEKNGIEFTQGIFDLFTITIENDAVKVKIIQDTKIEKLKRNSDVVVNAFSDKDLDGNDITPCSTTDILLKAKPIFQISKWKRDSQKIYTGSGFTSTTSFIDTSPFIIDYNIEKSFSSFYDILDGSVPTLEIYDNFKKVLAISELSSGTLEIDINAIVNYFGTNSSKIRVGISALVYDGFSIPSPQPFVYSVNVDASNTPFNLPNHITAPLPNLRIGDRLVVYFRIDMLSPSFISPSSSFVINRCETKIKYSSLGFDSVIKGVRLIDLIKHNIKSISTIDTVAPIYDVGGEHYENFAFNGYLIGQKTDQPFNNKFNDLIDVLGETNSDYQINENNVEILPYADFYTNNELAVFNELPDKKATSTFNKRYFLNTSEFKFKNSAKGRETNGQNTLDEIHGNTQWKFPNTLADANLKINFSHTRSAFIIEEQRRRITEAKKDTSLQYDDDLFIIDVVPLSPSTTRTLSAPLLMSVETGNILKILNNNTDRDFGNFNWQLLGFNSSATITLTGDENAGTYTISSIEPTILTLVKIGTAPTFNGESFINITYPINGVLYTNRTNEGFAEISGIENPNDYSNLKYSFKRILKNWSGYFATACKYVSGKEIKNTLFEINGNLQTRLTTETGLTIDNASIIVDEIAETKILNPITHKLSVFCEYEKALQLFKDIRDIKGYIRVLLNDGSAVKGFPTKIEYNWKTNELEMSLEEKYESDFMIITGDVGNIVLNGIPYGFINYKLNDIYVILYDNNNKAINNPIRFTNIKLNDIVYDNLIDFSDAIQSLI